MLKCRDMTELVTRYLDNALPPRARVAARLHLFLCDPCRRYVEQMRRTIRFLSDGPSPPPPAREEQILERLLGGKQDG